MEAVRAAEDAEAVGDAEAVWAAGGAVRTDGVAGVSGSTEDAGDTEGAGAVGIGGNVGDGEGTGPVRVAGNTGAVEVTEGAEAVGAVGDTGVAGAVEGAPGSGVTGNVGTAEGAGDVGAAEGVEAAVRAAEAGRRDRFVNLAREQLPRLYSIARALVGEEAEDAVQDCLFKAYERFGQLHDSEAAASWLRVILVNCCRDRGRAMARAPAQVNFEEAENFSLYRKIAYEDPFPYSDSLHLDFLHGLGREDVHAVLWRLPEIYRVPLILVHMQGFLAKEVARALGVPLGTVLARLHRGRRLFEKQLWEYAEQSGLLGGDAP